MISVSLCRKMTWAVIISAIGCFLLPAIAQAADYTLTVEPDTADNGEIVTIKWDVSTGANITNDWIGLFKAGDPSDHAHKLWSHYTRTHSGQQPFRIRTDRFPPGDYEFRYFINRTYNSTATANLTIKGAGGNGGGSDAYTLTVTPNSADNGEVVTIQFAAPTNANIPNDWIGLFKAGDPNDHQHKLWSKYTRARSGEFPFAIRTDRFPPGDYEFRYFINRTYTDKATAALKIKGDTGGGGGSGNYTLAVDPSEANNGQVVTISWTAPTGVSINNDWIGLFKAGDPSDHQHKLWTKYTRVRSGTTQFKVRTDRFSPGDYEFRYFINRTYNQKASAALKIKGNTGGGGGPGKYSLTIKPSTASNGQTVKIAFTTPNDSNNSNDWIGLFYKGNPSDHVHKLWHQYTRGARQGEISFLIRTDKFPPGDYDFRYFKNRTYNKEVEATLTITGDGGSNVRLDKITPNPSAPGKFVTLEGEFFQFNNTIKLAGNKTYQFRGISLTGKKIIFYLPIIDADTYNASVHNASGNSNTLPLVVGDTINYAALGDSIARGLSAARGYVTRYELNTETDLRLQVKVANHGVNGALSGDLRQSLQSDAHIRNQVTQAHIVTFNVGGNDLRVARNQYKASTCGGSDNLDCLRNMENAFKANWTAIVSEVNKLTDNKTIVRAVDIYNPFVGEDKAADSWSADGGLNDFQALKPYFDRVHNHMMASGVKITNIYKTFNGPDGTEDPRAKGYISLDGYHPNDSGHKVMSDALRALGYDELK